jgi:hypothetical protein
MLGYWPINYLPKKSNSNYFKITMFESPFCHFCNDSVLYFNNDTVNKTKSKLEIRGNVYIKK